VQSVTWLTCLRMPTAVKHATTAVALAAPASSPSSLGGRQGKQARKEASLSQASKEASQAFHPLWVRNDLGHPIVVRCGDQVQQIGAQGKAAVTCVPLVQSAGLLDGLPMLSVSRLHVHLPLEILTLWRAARGAGSVAASEVGATVRLDVIGRQVLTLQVGVEEELAVLALHAVKIVVDVLLEEGGASKVICMRSPLTITNKLSTPVEIMFAHTAVSDGPTMAGRHRSIIEAGASLMVPVLQIDNKDGFSLRPVTHAAAAAAGGGGRGGLPAALPASHPGYRWLTGLVRTPGPPRYSLLPKPVAR